MLVGNGYVPGSRRVRRGPAAEPRGRPAAVRGAGRARGGRMARCRPTARRVAAARRLGLLAGRSGRDARCSPSATAVAWVGDDADGQAATATAAEVVDLDGRLVTPGFVDAHVHLSKTGFALQTVDLGRATSMAEALDLLARAGCRATTVPCSSRMAGTRPLARGARRSPAPSWTARSGGRVAYVSRVDAHSAVVSSALVAHRARPGRPRRLARRRRSRARCAPRAPRIVVDALRSRPDRQRAPAGGPRQRGEPWGSRRVHEINAPAHRAVRRRRR